MNLSVLHPHTHRCVSSRAWTPKVPAPQGLWPHKRSKQGTLGYERRKVPLSLEEFF